MKRAQEHSYGIIPLRKAGDAWQVLLIHHAKGHWAFPKGHCEAGESPLETAQRELFEETHLEVAQLLSQAPLDEAYQFMRDGTLVEKKVSYFMALVTGEVSVDHKEVVEAVWASFTTAHDMLTFPEAQRLCSTIPNALSLVNS